MTRLGPLIVLVALALAAPASAQQRPQVTAPSAIVIDADSGEVVLSIAPDERRPIASATKLMTALLVLESQKLGTFVPAVRYRGLSVESKLGLRPGERMSVADLLRGLLIVSANDAAATLADRVSGSTVEFVRRMNARAKELGLRNTSFANPIGLDAASNYSSARDIATLARRLRTFPFFRKVVDAPQATLRTGARLRTIANRNLLVRRLGWIDGIKTGHTQGAGWVLVGSGRKRGVSLISVVLGTPSEGARQADTVKLLDFGFRRYRRWVAVRDGQVMQRVPIRYRAGAELNLIAARTITHRSRRRPTFDIKVIGAPSEVQGPIAKGQRFGTVEALLDGKPVGRVALVAASAVPEASAGRRAKDWFTRPGTLALLAGAAVAFVLLVTALGRRPGAQRQTTDPGEVGAA